MARALLCECGDCKTCRHRAYMRAYYRRPGVAERARQRVKRYRDANLPIVRDRDRARGFRETDRTKIEARQAVVRAIRSGVLTRGPCEVCGATPADAHHEDYSRPLDVRWLCERHHGAAHRTVAP